MIMFLLLRLLSFFLSFWLLFFDNFLHIKFFPCESFFQVLVNPVNIRFLLCCKYFLEKFRLFMLIIKMLIKPILIWWYRILCGMCLSSKLASKSVETQYYCPWIMESYFIFCWWYVISNTLPNKNNENRSTILL